MNRLLVLALVFANLVVPFLVATALADACPPGSSSPNGMEPCVPCDAGSWAPAPGATACFPCPSGTIAPSPGALSCTPCPAGQIAPLDGATECVDCPPGSFYPAAGGDHCLPCYEDEYEPIAGQARCLVCDPSEHSFGGATACATCQPLVGTRVRGRLTSDASGRVGRYEARGEFPLADGASFAALDPASQGMVLLVRYADGGDMTFVRLTGTYGATSDPVGWRRTASGRSWTYQDTRDFTGQTVTAVVRDLSPRKPAHVAVRLSVAGDFFPLVETSRLPIVVLVGLGPASESCGASDPASLACRVGPIQFRCEPTS